MADSNQTPASSSTTTLSWRLIGHESSGIKPLKLPDLSPPQPEQPSTPPHPQEQISHAVLPPLLVPQRSAVAEQPASEEAVATATPLAALESPAIDLPSFTLDPSSPTPPPAPASPIKSLKSIQWSNVVWGTTLAFGTLAAAAFIWLTKVPPPPNCQTATTTSMERLYCAREAARSAEIPQLLAGIELVSQWDRNDPLYNEAQESLTDWSRTLLWLAKEKLDQSDFDGAIALANQVPTNSPVYEEAQAAIAGWTAQWQQGEEIYAAAIAALKQQQWNKASDLIVDLGNLPHDYWRLQRTDELTQTVAVERTAWNTLRQARTLAKTKQPEKLSQAIALMQGIAPTTHSWTVAQPDLTQWSKTLTAVSLKRWQSGDLDGAIALALPMPLDYVTEPVVKDLIHYGRALELTNHPELPTWEPSWGKLWSLQEALSAIQPIQSDSPLYTQAQLKAADWQAQIQDLTQLQYANLTASIGHPLTLQWAIDQATTIAADRPRRLQAQTLVAHWGQEIQRMDDRPYLRVAEKIAASGTIAAFQQAIAIANQILQDRALWDEAQTAIAQWQDQIEILEDKPILAEAQTLAAANKLQEAIDKAETIPSDRALHAQAQAAIDGWQTKLDEIEIAADRPILTEAQELAAQQRYTLAIEAASQIGSDRALYGEAQASIVQWEIEREALLNQWALETPASEESGYTDYPPADEYSGVEGGAAIEDPLY